MYRTVINIAPSYKDLQKQIEILKQELSIKKSNMDFGEKIFNTSHTGIIIIEGKSHTIRGLNPVALKLLGYKNKQELIGKTCCECFCPKEEEECPITKNEPRMLYAEKEIRNKNGVIIPIMKSVDTIYKNGKRYIVEHFSDITNTKTLEERLKYTSKLALLGEAAAGIVHDLNNPLTGLRGGLQIIEMTLENFKDSAEKQKMLKMLKTSNHAYDIMYEMIRNILTYTRENHETGITNIYLKNNLENALEISKFNSFYKNQILPFANYNIQDVPVIKGINSHFYQIFLNLIQNAIHAIEDAQDTGILDKHHKQKLSINLSHSSQEKQIHFDITDTGIGIPDGQLHKIFKPHYTTKAKNRGTGLGLSSVLKTINKYNGQITVNSQPCKGTTFNITIPTGD